MEGSIKSLRRVRQASRTEAARKRFRPTLTENEEGEESFLSRCQLYVTTAFLTYTDEEDNPVWGGIMQYALGHSKANEVIGTNEELFDFLRPCFTPYVLERIRRNLVDGESSSLGSAYLKRGNYATFVKVLIAGIIEDAHENDVASSQAERGSQEVHDETNRLPTLSDSGDPIGENILNVVAGGEGGAVPGNGNEGDPAVNSYFQRVHNARRKVVIAGSFITPPKPLRMPTGKPDLQEVVRRVHAASGRTRTIQSRDTEFCEQAKRQYGLPSPEYAPGKQHAGDLVWIFHGTRMKNLQSFEEFGIWLEESHRSDFSRDKAFYASNSFQYSYEHVLLNVLRNFHDNYVIVYCFLVPFEELEGIVESQSSQGSESDQSSELGQSGQCSSNQSNSQTGQKLDRTVFLDGTPEWGALLKYNWETRKAGPSPQKDLIIGPIGVVEWTGRGSNRQREYRPVTRDDGDMPFQLAFKTPAAWSWLTRHLEYCYEEVRVEEDSAQPIPC